MDKRTKLVLGLLALGVVAGGAQADKFLQLSVTPTLQLVDRAESIAGIRLAICSENANVGGVDLGIANITKGDFTGVGLGIFNKVEGDSKGVQFGIYGVNLTDGNAVGWNSATFYNRVGGDVTGVHGGLVCWTGGKALGVDGGAVSLVDGDMSGWQMGLIYGKTAGHLTGLQTGLVNRAGSVKGLQLGLVNMTDDMYGIQIGLVNYIKNGSLPLFVIANGKF